MNVPTTSTTLPSTNEATAMSDATATTPPSILATTADRSARRPPPGGSFGRVVRAELQRVARPRSAAMLAIGCTLFAVVAGISVWLGAEEAGRGPVSRQSGARISDLAAAGGATEAFAVGASFGGFLVFVSFIALIAGEFSGGTFRAMLVRYPHRMRLIVGKLTGLLAIVAIGIALAEVMTVGVSMLMAPTQDVATSEWFTAAGLGEALADYAYALTGIAGWAIFGTTVAVIIRSIPLALGAGLAWAGPLENIIVDSWEPGFRFFPGQVLGSLIRGGTAELGFTRGVITALIYVGVAFAATLTLVSRRDVTA